MSEKGIDIKTVADEFHVRKKNDSDLVVALAGNPNVGKSTVFNALTGMNQHTGNWPGKTVANAQGYFEIEKQGIVMVDLPGCYSLMAHSAEEEVARDFICFGEEDGVVVVCDATCLERNLNLVLQTMEINKHVVLCLNLLDEAKKKNIIIDSDKLSSLLGIDVVRTTARKAKGLGNLKKTMMNITMREKNAVDYPEYIETAVKKLSPVLSDFTNKINPRWLALRLLEDDQVLLSSISEYIGKDILTDEKINDAKIQVISGLGEYEKTIQELRDEIISTIIHKAEKVSSQCVIFKKQNYDKRDRVIDKYLTSKWTGLPIMFIMLMGIFWITITGANYPSDVIGKFLFWIEDELAVFFTWLKAPGFLTDMLVHGVYRVLAWVVSVMLPPMAIFFPLFTLLEDFGFLPRVAFNLDKCFKRCCACGKQALTMCLGNNGIQTFLKPYLYMVVNKNISLFQVNI